MDKQQFLSIMSSFPSGVAVVTTIDEDGRPKGLTTTAVSSVSAEPPMLLVCVGTESRTLGALLHARRFAVNFIAQGHEAVCSVFASREEDKFANIEWETGPGGMPCLTRDVVAWAECEVEHQIEAGDHVIFVGRVIHGGASHPEREPAVYFRRTYTATV
jgi:flavin reductase ActVB